MGMSTHQTPHVFGYGSLVNRRTHDYLTARPAVLSGWRRAWRKTPFRDRCHLTAVPGHGEIFGLIAEIPSADWAALDQREAAYVRHEVSGSVRHDHPAAEVSVFAIAPENYRLPTPEDGVALSYIDVVAQGYLAEFGAEGLQHFFASTDGWHIHVVDDRAAPLYARAQALTAAELRLIDGALEALGVMRRAQMT